MTGDWLPAIAAIVGTAAGGAATYIAAHRKTSGRIRTSEASVLWEASESIRHDLTAALKAQAAELAAVKTTLTTVGDDLAASRAEIVVLSAELTALRQHLLER